MRRPQQVATWEKILVLIIGSTVLTLSSAGHFRGGTISWKSVGGNKVEFFFKMGWAYNRGPGCTAQDTGKFLDMKNQHWECVQGCSGTKKLTTVGYNCLGANKAENWEQGERRFKYTFPDKGLFDVEYTGGDWIKLDGGKGSGRWRLKTTVDLRTRSDTGRPNSSPEALNQPIYYLQHECHHELHIPSIDPDKDNVRCRWATGDECVSVCNALPGATLNEKTCTITFDATSAQTYVAGGHYAVALTIEDFPPASIKLDGSSTKRPKDALSSVPIQFLIQTPSFSTPCSRKPRFVSPTPAEGSTLLVQAGDNLTVQMVADNHNDKTSKITSMYINGPVEIKRSSLMPYKSVSTTFFKTLTWSTSAKSVGEYIVCSYATNSVGKSSDSRCFNIKIVPDPCQSQPCQHSGACKTIIPGVFNCSCVPGFTGMLCENIDDCHPDPCQNGATCIDKVNDYSCVCVPGYTDKNCSTAGVDFCQPDPCANGGVCQNGNADFTCMCADGWQGLKCTNKSSPLKTSQPQGGSCVALQNHFAAGHMNKDCCEVTEYSACECHISSYVPPEEEDILQKLIAALIGFPIGLVLSLLTYWLFTCCCVCGSCNGHAYSYRKTHPPRPRTEGWLYTCCCVCGSCNGHAYSYRKTHPPRSRTVGWLYTCCCVCGSCNGHAYSYRKTHPPRSRTEGWLNKSKTPTEEPPSERQVSGTSHPRSSRFSVSVSMVPLRSASSKSLLNRMHPTISEIPGGSGVPMNIYRTSFIDDTLPDTAPKKSPHTYKSGSRDWSI